MLTILAQAVEPSSGVPPIVYGIVAFLILAVLGLVTFSYRDVAHRHSDKSVGAHPESGEHE